MAVAQELIASGTFPTEVVIDELIRVQVPHAPGSASSYAHLGTPFDQAHEAQRVVHGVVQSGACQIPEGEIGVVFVDLGFYGDVWAVTVEVQRWMREEGSGYANVVGVMLLGDIFHESETLDALVPVWRDEAPRELKEATLWSDLQLELNWWKLVLLARRRDCPMS